MKAQTDNIRSLSRQNEAADTLARMGYEIEQQPKVRPTDTGVGPTKKPDYRIEGKVFDCFAPRPTTTARNIYLTIQQKVEGLQAPRILLNLDDSPVDVISLRTQLTAHPIQSLEEVLAVRGGTIQQIFP